MHYVHPNFCIFKITIVKVCLYKVYLLKFVLTKEEKIVKMPNASKPQIGCRPKCDM